MTKLLKMRGGNVLARMMWVVPLALTACLCGCNPVSTGVKLGMHVVGKVVDDEETQKIGQQLLGQSPAAADAALGQRSDELRDVNSSREWLVYPVKLDVMGNKRYVVEIARNQIVAVQMVERNSGKADIPLKLYYEAKVKGKTRPACESELNMGPPVLTVRSVYTGELAQLYDARMIKELQGPHYLVLRYDGSGLCTQANFVEVAATAQ